MAPDVFLDIGQDNGPVFEKKGQVPWLYVRPLLQRSKAAVSKFLQSADEIVPSSRALEDILKKSPLYRGP